LLDAIKQMQQAAQAPSNKLPSLLQLEALGAEAADLAGAAEMDEAVQEAEVAGSGAVESEELMPQVREDAEGQHRRASEGMNEASRSIAAAKAKIQKAQQLLKTSKKRIELLEQENETAVARWEHAHSRRTEFADKAFSIRLKQAERESLRGKHLKFDKETYAQRVRSGNLSTYGLWETSDEKQHFGEKTWDILSNHILGLDKLMNHVSNATANEIKAKHYLKMERQYAAQSAAAQEELLDLNAKVEQAETDIEEAKATIESSTASRTEHRALEKTARRKMAQEKAFQTSTRKKKMQLAAAQGRSEEEEEEGETDAGAEQAADEELEGAFKEDGVLAGDEDTDLGEPAQSD